MGKRILVLSAAVGAGHLLVNNAPHLLGYIYDRLDRPTRSKTGDRMRLAILC